MKCLAGISLVLSIALLGGSVALPLPQTAETLSGVKRIAVDWSETEPRSAAVRDHVLQKLKASNAVEIVSETAQADAILHGKAVIWVTGHVSQNPRSKSVEHSTYGGFASLEATGKNGEALWSYLVTPRTVTWKSIADDLADQLVRELLTALSAKGRAEKGSASRPSGPDRTSAGSVILSGAGGTFPAPIYQKWFESFRLSRPEIQIQYAAIGSQEGVQRFLAGQTDFGASDMPLSPQQLNSRHPGVLQLATLVGAVVPIYNVPGASGLNLTPEVLAGIFLGKIQRWTAPEIRAINKHLRLPDEAIVVVHRSDGSGTTYALSEYLSKVSPEWKLRFGAAPALAWPVGQSAEGNNGVATAVRKTANSIGYVELLFALQHELDFAAVRNASGDYVKADLDSVTAAARTADASEHNGFAVSISNGSGRHVYPIATFTWLVISTEGREPAKLAALRDLLRWMLTTGQRQCEGLGYAPLPPEFAKKQLQALSSLR